MHPDVPPFLYQQARETFQFLSLTTSLQAIKVLEYVRVECQKVCTLTLFHTGTSKHLKLEEYDQAQQQATTQVQYIPKSGKYFRRTENEIKLPLKLIVYIVPNNEN